MTVRPTHDPARTCLLLVYRYDSFLSDGGKLWLRVKGVAERVGLINDLKAVVKAAWEKVSS